jgi:hypothetical protein
MKRSCPENNFFYVIKELKAFRTLAKSLFSKKKTEDGNFLKFQKDDFTQPNAQGRTS